MHASWTQRLKLFLSVLAKDWNTCGDLLPLFECPAVFTGIAEMFQNDLSRAGNSDK